MESRSHRLASHASRASVPFEPRNYSTDATDSYAYVSLHPSQCREILILVSKLETDVFSKFGNFVGVKLILGSYLLLALVCEKK